MEVNEGNKQMDMEEQWTLVEGSDRWNRTDAQTTEWNGT